MTIKEQCQKYAHDAEQFQKDLAEFIVANELKIIVETGMGVSTVYILQAFDDHNIEGKLYSIDPEPWYPEEIEHPKLKPLKMKSTSGMGVAYINDYAWDLFLHDGNHDIHAMTYDIEMAYGLVREGGYIVCDDTGWNGHRAWEDFLERHSLTDNRFGSARIIQKKIPDFVHYADLKDYHLRCLMMADEAESEWLAKGNTNSPQFV